MTGEESGGPSRAEVIRVTSARLWRDTSTWFAAGFVGLMFATAVTAPIPAVADWQSAVICGAGMHLSHDEYTTQGGPEPADGSFSQPATGGGLAYHCAGPHSVSGSRTVLVLGIQFVAGTLATYLLILAFAIRSGLRRRDRVPATA